MYYVCTSVVTSKHDSACVFFCNLGSNSAFFEMTDVHQCSKVDYVFASRMTSFLLFTLSGCHADIFSSFFHSLRLLHPEFSSLEAWEWMYAQSCSDLLNKPLLQRCDPHDFMERVRSTRFLVDSWPATIHAHLVFLWELVLSLAAVSRSFLARCLHFAGIAASFGASNFYLAFLIVSWSSPSSASIKKGASQFSSVVELWLFQSPWRANPNFRPQIIKSGGCLDVCNSLPDHIIPGGGFLFQ